MKRKDAVAMRFRVPPYFHLLPLQTVLILQRMEMESRCDRQEIRHIKSKPRQRWWPASFAFEHRMLSKKFHGPRIAFPHVH